MVGCPSGFAPSLVPLCQRWAQLCLGREGGVAPVGVCAGPVALGTAEGAGQGRLQGRQALLALKPTSSPAPKLPTGHLE